jgi:hypothetical protein
MATDLIRWEKTDCGTEAGYAGKHKRPVFEIFPPDPIRGDDEWALNARHPLPGRSGYGKTEADVKQQAESWLRLHVSLFGAVFTADLRSELEELATTSLDHASDQDRQYHPATAEVYRVKADAFRDVIALLEHKEAQR